MFELNKRIVLEGRLVLRLYFFVVDKTMSKEDQ